MTFTYNSSVTVANPNATPVLTKHADNIQLDALSRMKVSTVQDQDWYTSSVDKDGDLRMVESFTSFVVTTTANGTQTNTTINVGSSAGVYPGAVLTDGSGVPYNPPTIVTSIPGGTSVVVNQTITVQNGATMLFNNARRTTTATGGQSSVTSLVVAATTGVYVGDPTTAFPINTFVVSITNGTTVVLSQTVTVSNADVINFDHARSFFNKQTSDVTMISGPSTDGQVIRQSKIKHKIIPGVSHTIYHTITWNGIDTNVTKRAGLYDANNGIFWEVDGTTINTVIRRTIADGSIVEDRVPRASWNVDKLDGTGASGFDITSSTTVSITSFNSISAATYGYNVVWNVTAGQGTSFTIGSNVLISGITPSTYNGSYMVVATSANTVTVNYLINPGTYSSSSTPTLYQSQFHKSLTFWIEFIGGRTGRIRFGLGTTAGPTIVHQYSYSGTISTSFINSSDLSKRWSITNNGVAPAYPASMTIGGSTFNVEAGGTLNPSFASASNNAGFAADSTLRPIIGFGLRPIAPYNSADLKLKSIDIIDTANRATSGNTNTTAGAYYWALFYNKPIYSIYNF